MDVIGGFWTSVLAFLLVLTVLVFVHELGHYLVARRNGVRIETFSIGFGPELFGFTDRTGTRWKFSALPLGGYVKMFGDADPASTPGAHLTAMSAEERAVSFHHKRVGQRAAIVAAGPIANFVFSIVVLALLFMTAGQSFTPPDVGGIQPGSAAERAGIKPGDLILSVDGTGVQRFEEIRQIVSIRPGEPLAIELKRDGRVMTLTATPDSQTVTDRLGNAHQIGLLGISRGSVGMMRHDPLTAVWQAGREVAGMVTGTFTALGQMVQGSRGTEELGGPLRIAQMSGEVAQSGWYPLVWFMTFLSVNLGLINLFPVPMLDGGHLLFYGIEKLLGRPLGARAQEYGFRIGLALVLTLMVFATWNDLVQLRVVDFFRGLVS
ncbi:regulator of sigma E protease [Azospirillum lipoferum]|uniref:Zinc metalloprotease n=1 Tax=Azospirillum lipoferum TaxID=193 RepID=A0A5A9GYC7_AZOLI|nr:MULTISPECIES: RIP metalloprotease RseP [Azospirillum]KAA0598705.1 RIP metalloprotease RseP [Azospirillum lipoferum]MCP1609272.1 regulator of sigma E protease [Azospirillum lipoferum]MDW5535418.1 RIP metalloprotease RseP [Azospirillum sp. NL1]